MKNEILMTENTNNEPEEVSDKLGIVLSVLCCIHCMATPLLMIFAPSLLKYFDNEFVHIVMLVFVIPVGLYSFISKLKIHEDKRPLYIGIGGMLLLAIAVLLHEFHNSLHGAHVESLETTLSALGGLVLIWAHVLNVRLCRCKTCSH